MFESLMNKIAFLGHWGYLLIFIAAFLESSAFMGFLVPGESIVVLAGFLSSHALLDIGDFLWVITLGAILGDSVGYSLGRVFGKDYFEKHDRLLFLKNKHIKSPKGIFRNTAERPFFWPVYRPSPCYGAFRGRHGRNEIPGIPDL